VQPGKKNQRHKLENPIENAIQDQLALLFLTRPISSGVTTTFYDGNFLWERAMHDEGHLVPASDDTSQSIHRPLSILMHIA